MHVIKNDDCFEFYANKIRYTVESLGDSIEMYETENPSKTGFVFDGGTKNFVLFINNITDIAEALLEEEEKKANSGKEE